MHTTSLLPLFLFLPLLGCQSLQSFPEKFSYDFGKDPLAPFYRENLAPIQGKNFDSHQVSNKHLDPRMIDALEKLNRLLDDPSSLPDKTEATLKKSGLKKVTIASASRSPSHQASLGSSYRAAPFNSNHLLGMAVDLEMKGKPFDIKRRGKEPQVIETYEALKETMAIAGLYFSEPVKKDPNHVELLAWSRKSDHPSYDFDAWKSNSLNFMSTMERRMDRILRNMPKSVKKRQLERQLLDLEKRIDVLIKAEDPRLLGGKR